MTDSGEPPISAATPEDILRSLPGVLLRRTAFPFIGRDPPLELTVLAEPLVEVLRKRAIDASEILNHRLVATLGNVYRRAGDLEYFVAAVETELSTQGLWKAAALTGTYLTAYFATAKALLDAAAITLDAVYDLKLAPKNQDFMKQALWSALSQRAPKSHSRYAQLRSFFQEVRDWRDSAIHRVSPLVMVAIESPTARALKSGEGIVRMADVPTDQFIGNESITWVDPMALPRRWEYSAKALYVALRADLESL